MQGAMPGLDILRQRMNSRGVGDITLGGMTSRTHGFDSQPGAGQQFGIDIGDKQARAAPGKTLGGSQTYAAAGTGNQNILVAEIPDSHTHDS
jgi:hypothetical protein